MTQPCAEQVQNLLLAININGSLAPIDLDGLSRSESQRNEDLRFLPSRSHIVNQVPDRGLASCEAAFFYQTLVNSTGSMPLLFDPFPVILIQTGRYELNHLRSHDSRFSAVLLTIPRDGLALPVLLNGIAGNTELLCRRALACNAL